MVVESSTKVVVGRQQGRHEDMIREAETAVALDPNDPENFIVLSQALILDGRGEEALAAVDRAMILDPFYPSSYAYFKGFALFSLKKYKEAAEQLEYALKQNPGEQGARTLLIATYAYLGKIREAKITLAEDPHELGCDWVKYYMRFKNPDEMAHLTHGLNLAGVPDVAQKLPTPGKLDPLLSE
jgi:adenylate cyclase